jgi:hypothetical protein
VETKVEVKLVQVGTKASVKVEVEVGIRVDI